MHLSNTFYCSQATDLATTKVKLTEYWISLFTNLVLAVDSECMQRNNNKTTTNKLDNSYTYVYWPAHLSHCHSGTCAYFKTGRERRYVHLASHNSLQPSRVTVDTYS